MGPLCTQSYISGFNKVRVLSKGQKSVGEGGRGRNQGRLLGRGAVSAGPWKIVVEMLNVFLHSIIYSVNIVGFHVPGSVLRLRMYYEQNRQILRDWNSSRSRR